MQIEFYLPLPSDGFFAGLVIYYLVGLLITTFVALRHGVDPPENPIELTVMSLIIIPLFIWSRITDR